MNFHYVVLEHVQYSRHCLLYTSGNNRVLTDTMNILNGPDPEENEMNTEYMPLKTGGNACYRPVRRSTQISQGEHIYDVVA